MPSVESAGKQMRNKFDLFLKFRKYYNGAEFLKMHLKNFLAKEITGTLYKGLESVSHSVSNYYWISG
jgi:hypothetical protein